MGYFNGGPDDRTFFLQEGGAEAWRRVIDTDLAGPDDFMEPGREERIEERAYCVRGRSVVF
jgi:hypothetical protein